MQFERRGYYRVDKVVKEGDNIEYNLIFVPDGKAVGLASIAKKSDTQGDIAKQTLADKVAEKKVKETKGKDKKKKGEPKPEQADAKIEEAPKAEEVPKAEEATKEEAPKAEEAPKVDTKVKQ